MFTAAIATQNPDAGSYQVNLAPSANIPLDRLELAPGNVRRMKKGLSIEALANDIAYRSLLQSLSVRPILADDGSETGRYLVQGGGRRLRALQLLVKQKRLAHDAPVPCVIKSEGMVEDDSLAENSARLALHPLDQFRAFANLLTKGMTETDIAAAHGVTPAVVTQRLRLAAASPKLLKAFENDQLNLEQLMAFCLTPDHKRQNLVWKTIADDCTAYDGEDIRHMLTENSVCADDRRVRFVTLEAYEAAGGVVLRDLFSDEQDCYLEDVTLLTELVDAKLEATRQSYLGAGWKWVTAAVSHPYNVRFSLTPAPETIVELTAKQKKQLEKLAREHDRLSASDHPWPDAVAARVDELELAIDALENPSPQYDADVRARAGVLIALDHDGQLEVTEGLIRPEDVAQSDREDDATFATDQDATSDDASEPDRDALPDRLVQDLTSYRTAALRDAVSQNYDVAFLAILHALAEQVFFPYSPRSCVRIVAETSFPDRAPKLADMPFAQALATRHDAWQKRLPQDLHHLWTALQELTATDRAVLFAHCVAMTVNAVQDVPGARTRRSIQADAIGAACALDVGQAGFVPDVDTYFGRVTKAKILEAVAEATNQITAKRIADLKKPLMAKEAARLTAGTGWLPKPLRPAAVDTDASPSA